MEDISVESLYVLIVQNRNITNLLREKLSDAALVRSCEKPLSVLVLEDECIRSHLEETLSDTNIEINFISDRKSLASVDLENCIAFAYRFTGQPDDGISILSHISHMKRETDSTIDSLLYIDQERPDLVSASECVALQCNSYTTTHPVIHDPSQLRVLTPVKDIYRALLASIERTKMERNIAELKCDEKTGAYTSTAGSAIYTRMKKDCRDTGYRIMIIKSDINGLTDVNTFAGGHAAGDAYLKTLAEGFYEFGKRMGDKGMFGRRKDDYLLIRDEGSDEFTFVARITDKLDENEMLHTLESSFSEREFIPGYEVGFSAGYITFTPSQEGNIEDNITQCSLIHKADKLQIRAKQGKKAKTYSPIRTIIAYDKNQETPDIPIPVQADSSTVTMQPYPI